LLIVEIRCELLLKKDLLNFKKTWLNHYKRKTMKYTQEQLKPIIDKALKKKQKAIKEMIDKGILPSEKTLKDLQNQAQKEIEAGRQKLLDQ
jgi:septin family protein